MKAIIDTCVILDYLLERDDFFEDARKIFELCSKNKIDAYVTTKSIMDIHYVIKHYNHNEVKTRLIIHMILNILNPLSSRSKEAVKALDSMVHDYEDALMVETAISNKIDCIITRNVKDYKKATIDVYSPDQILKKFK